MTDFRPQPGLPAHRLALLMAAALAVAACTRPTSVESDWAQGVPRDQSFGHVLVVGVSPAYNLRCRFERLMRDSLVAAGIQAETSCSRLRSTDLLTRDAIVRLVQDMDVDAVLATRLVDASVALEKGGTDEARGEAYVKPVGYGHDPYFGAFGLPVTYVEFVNEPPALTMQRTVVVSTNLYAVESAALVYAIDTVVHDRKSPEDVAYAVTGAVAARLARDGLLR